MTKLLLTFIAAAAICFGGDPFVGAWKPANVEKWKTGPSFKERRKAELVTFEASGKDQYRYTISAPDNISQVWRMDGKDHKLEKAVTSKEERIDERHLRRTLSNSKGSYVADWVVSADGKTLTHTKKGTDIIDGSPLDDLWVFEKQ